MAANFALNFELGMRLREAHAQTDRAIKQTRDVLAAFDSLKKTNDKNFATAKACQDTLSRQWPLLWQGKSEGTVRVKR